MKDIDLTSLNNIDNLLIFKTKIGYVSGNKTEPIKNIFFYNIVEKLFSLVEFIEKKKIQKMIKIGFSRMCFVQKIAIFHIFLI